MLTTEAGTAEASARDDLLTLLTRGFVRSRAGLVAGALADLERVRAEAWPELGDLDRAALLTTALDCRLARGEVAAAMDLGSALEPLLACPGLVGATAHFGRAELAAATGDADLAADHFNRCGGLLADG